MLAPIAAGIIAFNILLGLTTIITGIVKHRPPQWLAIVHGLVGLTGYGFLIAALIAGERNGALYTAAVIFAAVAAAGITYNVAQWRGKAPPTQMMFLHGIAAILGFVFLAVGAAMVMGRPE